MKEMEKRGYHPDKVWYDWDYRGKTLGLESGWIKDDDRIEAMKLINNHKIIYPEHNDAYLQECINILKSKGIKINLEGV